MQRQDEVQVSFLEKVSQGTAGGHSPGKGDFQFSMQIEQKACWWVCSSRQGLSGLCSPRGCPSCAPSRTVHFSRGNQGRRERGLSESGPPPPWE